MKLLFAEPDRDLARTLTRVLEYNKYAVDTVDSGEEAFGFLRAVAYDGAILDETVCPDVLSALRALREGGSQMPVLLLSDDPGRIPASDLAPCDVLAKPFVIKELMARVRALTRKAGSLPEAYSVGNLTLCPETQELSAEGTVRLTAKEYKLMEFLIRNRDTLLPTERIMAAVWNAETEIEHNVVWVFISSLRKKMESVGAACLIRAVRGVGYRLEVK